MKIVIIGGVSAGTKLAAKLLREDRNSEVTILTDGNEVSYSACGLPYYVGGLVKDKSSLIIYSPKKFTDITGAKVVCDTKITKVDTKNKTVTCVTTATGKEDAFSYDKLVISIDSSTNIPEIDGLNLKNVFVLRTLEDAVSIRQAIEESDIKRACVIGGGFHGLEIAENLHHIGVRTTVIEAEQNVLSSYFDSEICNYIENKMALSGVMPMTGVTLQGIEGAEKVEKIITSKRAFKTDAVILATGIKVTTNFLKDTEIAMENGIILTDENFQTNIEDIYAVGDCAYVKNRITGQKICPSTGSNANVTGRILAENIVQNNQKFEGTLGTAIAKISGNITIGVTGLTETNAKSNGYNTSCVVVTVNNKEEYYPEAGILVIKLVADTDTKKVLGVQVVGDYGVDKIVDIIVTAISLGATLEQMQNLDFSYSPPFGTPIHPISTAVNVLKNKIDGKLKTITPLEFSQLDLSSYKIIDVSRKPTIQNADYIELGEITKDFDRYDKSQNIIIVCTKGRRAYIAQNRLEFFGFTNTKVLESGTTLTEVEI